MPSVVVLSTPEVLAVSLAGNSASTPNYSTGSTSGRAL